MEKRPIGAQFEIKRGDQPVLAGTMEVNGEAADLLRDVAANPKEVTLARTATELTEDMALWMSIRNRSSAMSFDRYAAFIHRVLCASPEEGTTPIDVAPEDAYVDRFGAPSIEERLRDLGHRPTVTGSEAYLLLRAATQAFLLFQGGVEIAAPPGTPAPVEDQPIAGESARLGRPITYGEARALLEQYLGSSISGITVPALPYLKRIVGALLPAGARDEVSPFCEGLLRQRLSQPMMIELIYNFWSDCGGTAATMNAIATRFQNRRVPGRDPLRSLDFNPLRPLANLLWGYVRHEPDRVSLLRRAHELEHQYGFSHQGRALAGLTPADSRVRFIPAFHRLLSVTARFLREDGSAIQRADGFEVLHALADVHAVVTEGGNQVVDLTFEARVDCLLERYLLATNEMREFLRGRSMVAQSEPWMGAVLSMNQLQGWTDINPSVYHTLALSAERMILSIRFGDWSRSDVEEEQARNWARYFRQDVRQYIHAYASVCGVDLGAETVDVRAVEKRNLAPSILLRQRRLAQQGRAALPSGESIKFIAAELTDEDAVPAPARSLRRTR